MHLCDNWEGNNAIMAYLQLESLPYVETQTFKRTYRRCSVVEKPEKINYSIQHQEYCFTSNDNIQSLHLMHMKIRVTEQTILTDKPLT